MLFGRFHVVMLEHETLADMQAHPVDERSVGFGIEHDYIVAVNQTVNRGKNALITEIEYIGGFFADKIGQILFQFHVLFALA